MLAKYHKIKIDTYKKSCFFLQLALVLSWFDEYKNSIHYYATNWSFADTEMQFDEYTNKGEMQIVFSCLHMLLSVYLFTGIWVFTLWGAEVKDQSLGLAP